MPNLQTYSDFQALSKSEKIALVQVEASKRLMGWVLSSGTIYILTSFDCAVIQQIADSGVVLTAVASAAAVTAGTYFNDRVNKILYLNTSDSVNPNGKFMAMTFRLFFSNVSITAPNDLNTGTEVQWIPYVKNVDQFALALDLQYQMGQAIQGTGNLVLHNDQSFWQPLFDSVYFENQRVFIYSWHRELPITQAQLVYRGRIDLKTYESNQVSFRIKDYLSELNSPVPLQNISALAGARVPTNIGNAYQRLVYGYIFGHRPTNIDHVLTGYPMTGTVAVTNGSTTLTGTSTLFTTELSPNDQVYITNDTTVTAYTIQDITSDTAAVLTQAYTGLNYASSALTQKPALPKRWQNRKFLIAGHSLCQPSTTVGSGKATTLVFPVVSTQGFLAGDTITVGSSTTVIKNISGNYFVCSFALNTIPTAGTTVTRATVSGAYIDDQPLIYPRDFTYNATTGTITLDKLAEFNVAPIKSLPGTVSFTTSSTAVTGTGTSFTKFLKSGDWIVASGQAQFFEILKVTDDTNLILRVVCTYTASSVAGFYKTPNIYNEGSTVLSVDTMGATVDGTISGALLYRAPDIVKDLVTKAGLSSSIEPTSFTNASALCPQRVGYAIPANYGDTTVPSAVAAINAINQSVFGSLIQNSSFQLQYSIFSPSKPSSRLQLRELDVIKWSLESRSDNLVQTVEVDYLNKEYDYLSKAKSFQKVTNTSKNAKYLAGSTNSKVAPSILIDVADATTLAGRLGFVLEVSSTVLTVSTKLQAMTTNINDSVEIAHEKLYQRLGSTSKRKFGAVQQIKKTALDVELDIEDLANAFSRCACITASTALSFSQAPDSERVTNGYITDQYGMINNDPTTFGQNLIW